MEMAQLLSDEFSSQRDFRFSSMRYMFDIVLGISAGSEVGTVAAAPVDFNNTLSYSILSQTLNGAAVSYFVIANTASGGSKYRYYFCGRSCAYWGGKVHFKCGSE